VRATLCRLPCARHIPQSRPSGVALRPARSGGRPHRGVQNKASRGRQTISTQRPAQYRRRRSHQPFPRTFLDRTTGSPGDNQSRDREGVHESIVQRVGRIASTAAIVSSVGNPLTRRVGTVVIAAIIGGVLVAGLVAIAIRTSVPDAILVGLVTGVLGSAATAVATLLAVRWTMEGQRTIDRESREFERHVTLLTQRAADLRDLGVTLTDMVTAARRSSGSEWGRASRCGRATHERCG
jgi:hypothetical protein